jgi:hypothetical protein
LKACGKSTQPELEEDRLMAGKSMRRTFFHRLKWGGNHPNHTDLAAPAACLEKLQQSKLDQKIDSRQSRMSWRRGESQQLVTLIILMWDVHLRGSIHRKNDVC